MKFTNNNYSINWIFEIENTFAESQGKYLTFFKPNFQDKILVKIVAIKDSFNLNNKENEVLRNLEFEKIK